MVKRNYLRDSVSNVGNREVLPLYDGYLVHHFHSESLRINRLSIKLLLFLYDLGKVIFIQEVLVVFSKSIDEKVDVVQFKR